MKRVGEQVNAEILSLYLAGSRQAAQGIIEFALMIVVLVAVASIGLGALGVDLQGLFTGLGGKLKLPAGF